MRSEHLGRYSFLACNPKSTLRVSARHLPRWRAPAGASRSPHLRTCWRKPPAPHAGPAALPGRACGLHRLRIRPAGWSRRRGSRTSLPSAPISCCITSTAWPRFDHMQERAWIISTTRQRPTSSKPCCSGSRKPSARTSSPAGNRTSRARPMRRPSRRTVEYILAGDIFQANITQMFAARIPPGLRRACLLPRAAPQEPGDLRRLHGLWRHPDRLVLARAPAAPDGDGSVEARPIKGTRRRDADPARDASAHRRTRPRAARTAPRT